MNRCRRKIPSASNAAPIAVVTSPAPIIGTDKFLWSPSMLVLAPTIPVIASASPSGPRIAPVAIRGVPFDGGPFVARSGPSISTYSGTCPGGPQLGSAPASGAWRINHRRSPSSGAWRGDTGTGADGSACIDAPAASDLPGAPAGALASGLVGALEFVGTSVTGFTALASGFVGASVTGCTALASGFARSVAVTGGTSGAGAAAALPLLASTVTPRIAAVAVRFMARIFAQPAPPSTAKLGYPRSATMPLPRLNGTYKPTGSPRYDQLFAGQVVSVVLSVGFDEYGSNRPVDDQIKAGLLSRGFRVDTEAALARLAAGKRGAPSRPGDLYIAQAAALDLSGHPVDVVVTLALAGDGSAGGHVASAYLDGLGRCDVAAYGGHGRYGTGPDFDYNFTADVVDDHGNITASFSEYKDLEEALTAQGKAHGRSALAEYRLLLKQGRLVIRRINSGNLVINLRNYHAGEFGSHLMVDQLATDANIRRMSKQKFDKRYRMWLFNGCRTHDYFYNLRKLNPAINAGGLDLVGTRRVVYWNAIGDSLLAFLDGILARDDRKHLVDRLAAVNPTDDSDGETGPSHVIDAH